MLETHAIVMIDPAGIIRMWSTGAERLFGYDEASALGQTLDLIIPEAYRDWHWASLRSAVSHGHTKLDQPAANIPVACRDGSVVRFEGRLIFLRDARDHVVGVMGIFSPNDGSDGPALPDI